MKTCKPKKDTIKKGLKRHMSEKNIAISKDEAMIQEKDGKILNFDKINEMKEDLGSGFLTVMQHILPGILVRPEKINQAFKIYNLVQVAMESHALKSVCRQVGLLKMGELAARIESLAASGERLGVESLIEQLIPASVSANHALTKYCSTLGPAPLFPIKAVI